VPIVATQEHAGVLLRLRDEQLRLGELAEQLEVFTREILGLPAWHVPLAWAHAQAGRVDEAHAVLDPVRRDRFAALPRDVNFDAALAMLAHTAEELGDRELAAEIEPLLRPLADFWVVLGMGTGSLGPVAYCVGVCNLLIGRVDSAVGDFEAAIAKCRQVRSRPHEAHASLRLSWALRRRGARGDVERAAGLEASALAIGRELGMARLLRDARSGRTA
jgi:hypothetical protein